MLSELRTDRLKAMREAKGWSQRELARRCGIGATQVRNYETGESDPSATYLKNIADQLDVSSDYLLGRTDLPNGLTGDTSLSDEELTIIDTFRRDDWQGVARLSVEKLSGR